jgi:uncharacterized repeat protein (TIGR02543 family)/prepilin-type N-terminal cleavage/methylation domain-containing protein
MSFKYNKKYSDKFKGFTLVELLAVIVIVSIIASVACFIAINVINNSKSEALNQSYSSLKDSGVNISKELGDDYWEYEYNSDTNSYNSNILVTCISVQNMINYGYYKENDFKDIEGIDKDTFVIIKKDYTNKSIISEEIDETGYCINSFNNAKLEVTNYTDNSVSLKASCSDSATYTYSYRLTEDSEYSSEVVGGDTYTFTGLSPKTKYNFKVTCSSNKIGNISQTTGDSIKMPNENTCSNSSKTISITYPDTPLSANNFFEINGSSGSVDGKYKVYKCIDDVCETISSTSLESNVLYKVDNDTLIDNTIKIKIDNNGTVNAKTEGEDKFSTTKKMEITTIDTYSVNKPNVTSSDNVSSGNWHNGNYTLSLSGGKNDDDNTNCGNVTYQYSKDNINFSSLDDNLLSIDSEGTYYFRSVNKAGTVSEVNTYVSKIDKTKPVCSFSTISKFKKGDSIDITLSCTDSKSGIKSTTLTSSNFSVNNVSITSVSSPVAISNGYKYTITIKGSATGTNSYISLNAGSIKDNAKNGNNTLKSNTFEIEKNEYTLTYDNQSGSGCTSKIGTYGSTWGSLCTPTRTGYTFGGWYTSKNGSGTMITSSSTVTDDITVYAKWTVNTYTITLNNQSATSAGTTYIYETYGSKYSLTNGGAAMTTTKNKITMPTKTGYTFGGYYTKTNGGGTQYINASGYLTSSASNTYFSASGTLYAKWTVNTYTLTYDNQSGSGCTSETGTYGSTWGSLCTSTRTGYTFGGWYTSTNGGGTQVTSSTKVTGDKTVYAYWKSSYSDSINGYRCSSSDLYYITTCQSDSVSGAKCNYTKKNDISSTGTVTRSTLKSVSSSCANYQIDSSNYSKYINNAIDNASSGSTIKLLKSVTDNNTATFNKNITFNTNGYTLTRSSTITVNSGKTLTVTGTGGISTSGSSNLFDVSGTLAIKGGTYTKTGGSDSSAVNVKSGGKVTFTDNNYIRIIATSPSSHCSTGINSESSNAINVSATGKGISIYGYCYGIFSSKSAVTVTTSSATGISNTIVGNLGYAIYATSITFGTPNTTQNGSTAYYPYATSNSYITNTVSFPVLSSSGTITFNSGTLYTGYAHGTYQSDGDKPTYTGTSDKYGGVNIGSLMANKTISKPSGYTIQYFTSSAGLVGLRIVKN